MKYLLLFLSLFLPVSASSQTQASQIVSCIAGDVNTCLKAAELAEENNDPSLYFSFVRQGCKLNDATTCNILGALYRHGVGTKQSYRLSHKISTIACDAGVAKSCLRIGFLYNAGQGTKYDRPKAREYYAKACDLGLSAPYNAVCEGL